MYTLYDLFMYLVFLYIYTIYIHILLYNAGKREPASRNYEVRVFEAHDSDQRW